MLTGGRGDARNLIGVVVEVTDDRLYRIGTKEGRLNTLLACSEHVLHRQGEVPARGGRARQGVANPICGN